MLNGYHFSHYHLLMRISRSGRSEIYLAEQQPLRQKVAVKIVPNEPENLVSSVEEERLFDHEARAIALLDHPNILPLLDFGECMIDGTSFSFLVIPFHEDVTLETWMDQHPLSQQDIAHFIGKAADLLEYLHNRHIIHQDVNPSHFLIRPSEELLDNPFLWGIRKGQSNGPTLLLSYFGIRKFHSPPAYMAPEQWKGSPLPASDQYALAITAYQLLTGQLPFRDQPEQLMRQHLEAEPQPATMLNSDLPKAVDAVLLRALEKQPEHRFASVKDFARLLHRALTPYALSYSFELVAYSRGWYLWTTLSISEEEAVTGTARTITLPTGEQARISIPAGSADRQGISLITQRVIKPPRPPASPLVIPTPVKISIQIGQLGDETGLRSHPDPLPLVFHPGSRGKQVPLIISKQEAVVGTTRTITLPTGSQVSIPIPPGASDGQILLLQRSFACDGPGHIYTVCLTIQ